jgi:phosphate transport system protein
MATEQPVAGDLRLSTSILQASLHLERLGDLSVYLGNTTHEIHDLPIPESLHKIVVEMGDMVIDMASSALESLKNRDAELALSTARKDELINSLYNKMLNEVSNISGNKDLYSGLFRLITCVRTLERGGDHAVDICELASFLVTGEFKEF